MTYLTFQFFYLIQEINNNLYDTVHSIVNCNYYVHAPLGLVWEE